MNDKLAEVRCASTNGKTLAQGYNRRWEATSVVTGPMNLQYAPTPAGDVGQVVENGLTLPFGYDFLDRLTTSAGWFAYGYDGNGNRASEWLEGTALVYGYNQDRVKEAYLGGTTVKKYAFAYDYQTNVSGIGKYDAAGSSIASAVCLRHDPLGRLVMAGPARYAFYVTPDATTCTDDWYVSSATAKFKYDHRNRRVAGWRATTNEWVYMVFGPGGEPLAEIAKTTNPASPWRPVREYVWLEGKPIAQIERDVVTGASRVYAIHVDHIGLPRALTSPGGVTVWSASPARPFGDITEVTTPDPETGKTVVTNLRLPGQYDERLLGSVGLQGPYYNWNRWYLPSVGRYLELDPIAKAGGFNSEYGVDWYNYVEGNPLTRTDRTGEWTAPNPANDLDAPACMAKGCPSTTACPSKKLLNNTCYLTGCNFGPRGKAQIIATGECYYRCRDGALPWKNMTTWGPGPTLGCSNKPDCE